MPIFNLVYEGYEGPSHTDFLLVAGGGGGGYPTNVSDFNKYSGGGGAGGTILCTNYDIPQGSYCIIIGNGGDLTMNGGDSCFGNLSVCGGGAGGGYYNDWGKDGGSGGGSAYNYPGGCGISGQGHDSYCCARSDCYGGGGGGAGGPGGVSGNFADGGIGIQTDISGDLCYYGGGGGGAGGGQGGLGGGGSFGNNATYYGGGGGGKAKGFQGIFIIRYKTGDYDISGGCTYTCGDYTIHCFTSNGTLTVN